MNEHTDLEGRVADWLDEESRGELPEWVLSATFHQTRREPQKRGLRDRLAAVRPMTHAGPEAPWRWNMLSPMRVAVAAVLVTVVGAGLLFGIAGVPSSEPGVPGAAETSSVEPTELLDITLEGDVIPEAFSGVLFSRKTYPTDQETEYTETFLPPNSFIRYVESGELGIRPVSDTQVVRAGSTWDEAATVAAGEETVIGPGDAFAQIDVPWEEHGIHALGEMWTPGDDAVIVSLAIREPARCCSMGHPGMESRWYHTLTDGVQELSDAPIAMRIRRWELPVGEAMKHTTESTPRMWVLDAGLVDSRRSDVDVGSESYTPSLTAANTPLWPMNFSTDVEMIIENVGEEPAVLYQLLVEPAVES